MESLIENAAPYLGLHCSPKPQDARLTWELIILGSIMISCLIWVYTSFPNGILSKLKEKSYAHRAIIKVINKTLQKQMFLLFCGVFVCVQSMYILVCYIKKKKKKRKS